jgi:HAD superfamily hydrolase (TIGR01509 family)
MALKALLFDLDGTIAETDPIHHKAWGEFLAPLGMTVDDAFYQRHILGKLNSVIFQEIMPGLTPEAAGQMGDQKEAQFRRIATSLAPLPGLAAFLDRAAAAGLGLIVVTNAPRANAEHVLEATGLTDRFSHVISGQELPEGKPHPMPYLEGLRHFGISPDEALAFEDSASGLRSAVGAGIATVGITSSLPEAALLELGAALAVADYADARLHDLLTARL